MNKCIFSGRLTADPQLKQTPSGVSVCSFSLAVDRTTQKDKEKTADFINMVAWRQKGEIISRYLSKGSRVLIEAAVRTNKYQKDGQTHYVTEFIVNEVYFIDSRRQNDDGYTMPNKTEYSDFCDIENEDYDLPY